MESLNELGHVSGFLLMEQGLFRIVFVCDYGALVSPNYSLDDYKNNLDLTPKHFP